VIVDVDVDGGVDGDGDELAPPHRCRLLAGVHVAVAVNVNVDRTLKR
jgi:hypothetical protein